MSLLIMNYQGVKLSIQANEVKMTERLEKEVQNMIKKLRRHLPDINWIDIYLRKTRDASRPSMATIRFGIPGPDIVVSDSGNRWKTLIKNIEKGIIRRLEKRKLPM